MKTSFFYRNLLSFFTFETGQCDLELTTFFFKICMGMMVVFWFYYCEGKKKKDIKV